MANPSCQNAKTLRNNARGFGLLSRGSHVQVVPGALHKCEENADIRYPFGPTRTRSDPLRVARVARGECMSDGKVTITAWGWVILILAGLFIVTVYACTLAMGQL